MIYNLTPILDQITPEIHNRDIWIDRITSFFNNHEHEPSLQDSYYDILIKNADNPVNFMLSKGYLIDPYTGLFTFDLDFVRSKHSFNIAGFVSSNYQYFHKKKIMTICSDYGMMNIQMKLAGLDVVSGVQKDYLNVGTVLACIGNNSPPYPINKFDVEEDVLFLSCVFDEEDLAYKNWEMMLEKKIDGKEVFFTSDTFFNLRNYINYDRIEPVIDPKDVYKEEDYADTAMGYMNKIYRIK